MKWLLHADTQECNRYREILVAFEQRKSLIGKYMRLTMLDYLIEDEDGVFLGGFIERVKRNAIIE